MGIERYTTDYLLSALDREFPGYECTLSKCATCDRGARGEWCNECLVAEIKRRAPGSPVAWLCHLLWNRSYTQAQIAKAVNEIMEAAK